MAHFAKVKNGVVQQVIVVSNDDAPSEAVGQTFLASLGLDLLSRVRFSYGCKVDGLCFG
jgi:hypothetical protein